MESKSADGKSWSKQCDHATSKGLALDFKISQELQTSKDDGKQYATTIIFDDADYTTMRLSRVELVEGKAQRFFVESLKKIVATN